MSWSASAFQPVQSRISTFKQVDVVNQRGFVLQASLIDPEEEPEATDTSDTWKKIQQVNDKFWDYTVNFFYVIMTLGILLNLSGYAYKVSPEGVTIKTIEEHRQDLLWNQEIQRMENEVAMKQQFMLENSEL